MSSPVVEKQFVWRFIDKITSGVKRARQEMQETVSVAKKAGIEVSNTSENWKKVGDEAKQSAEETSQSVNKIKNDTTSMKDKAKETVEDIRGHVRKLTDDVKEASKPKVINLKAKFDDSKLKSFSRKITDLPSEKTFWLKVKDGFSDNLKQAQQQANNTKNSFSMLKSVMAGTFVGGAILNGVYAIGNGLKEATAAGMEFDTEQQKMLATWHTLTGSNNAAQGMVDTINNLSIKTGQATDTINELEQGFYHLHSSKSEADSMTEAMLNMGDAVGLSGQQLTQVEQDMVHGLATGKVTQGELNQIGMYFPMIDEKMAKHFDTTVAGMRKMASAGKITGDDLEKVFEEMGNSGKYKHAVDNMMQTSWGSMRTIKSMVPRLIGEMEQGLFNARNPLIGAVAKWTTDPATKKEFQNFGKTLSAGLTDVASIVMTLHEAFKPLNQVLGTFIKDLGSGALTGAGFVFKTIAVGAQAISNALSAVTNWIAKFIAKFAGVKAAQVTMSAFHVTVKDVGTVLGALVATLGAMKVVSSVVAGIKSLTTALKSARLAMIAIEAVAKLGMFGPITIGITLLIGAFTLAYKKIEPFRKAVDSFVKNFQKGLKSLLKDLPKIGKAISNFFKGDTKWQKGDANWEKDLKKKFNSYKKEYQKNQKEQLKLQEEAQKEQKKKWDDYWSNLNKKSRDTWNDLKKHTKSGLDDVKKHISNGMKSARKTWSDRWDDMQDVTSSAWSWIKKHSSNGMDRVHDTIQSGQSTINRLWQNGWNTFSNIFKSIWNGIKQAAQNGINGVISIINAGIDGINKVWNFFTGHNTGISKLGKVHFAQGGTVHRHLSVINDGDGPDWKELVQMPDGGLFMSQERNWTGFLPEGARVYSGPETKQIMNAVGVSHYATGGIVGAQHFADGGIIGDAIDWTKGTLDNIGSWIGDKIDALMKFLDDPVKSIKGVVNKAVSGMYSGLGNFGDLAKGNWDKLTDNMGDWIKEHLEPVLDKLLSSNPGGAGVARWRPYIERAAKQLGINLTSGMMQKMLTQINTESGGNPGAIGGTDGLSDGHATGLLQFKPGTFRHWAVAGHGNIMSGYDQILAAFNTLQHGGEGGWSNFGIPGKGWATGGEITSQMLGWVGDNPEHHEFVINPYAVSAEPLLDKAFESTAQAQPASAHTSTQGNSKMDTMIDLLGQLLVAVQNQNTDVYLDGEAITRNSNKRNAKNWALRKGQ